MAELFSLTLLAALCRIELVKIPPNYSLPLHANSRVAIPVAITHASPSTTSIRKLQNIKMKVIMDRKISSI